MSKPNLFEQIVLPLFEEHREDWLDAARMAAVRLGKSQPVVTIDDVREVCPPPPGVDPRVMGAVFWPRDVWERVGFVSSKRKACHNRPVAQHRYIG